MKPMALKRVPVIVGAAVLVASGVMRSGRAIAQGPVQEARAVWLQTEVEPPGASEAIVKRLKEHGFNMILAYYWPWDGDRFNRPASEPVRELDLKDLIAKAHANGLEVHCWIFGPAIRGKEEWKCQGYDPEKKKLVTTGFCSSEEEILKAGEEAIKQLVKEYPFDGLQMDEVAGDLPWKWGLDDRCRQRFQKDTGLKVEHWPDDVLQVDRMTGANRGDPTAWLGKNGQQWIQWKCQLIADGLGRYAKAARSIRKLDVSYACRPESWANPIFYSEDLSLIAKQMDFMVPMTYFSEYSAYQEHPEATGAWAKELAQTIWRGNPNCQVYAAVSTFSQGYGSAVGALFETAVKSGKISQTEKQQHLLLSNAWEARASMQWLKEKGAVSEEDWQKAHKRMEAGLATADEVMVAIQSVRSAGLKGVVFFPYQTMWADRGDSVVGREELSARLKQAFAEPAALPHRPQDK